MNCGAFVVWEERRRRGSGKPYMKVSRSWPSWVLFVNKEEAAKIPTDAVRCDGNIIATIQAVDEPYMGGHSAELEVTYKCDKCGANFFNELPMHTGGRISAELSAFVTAAIAALPEEYRNQQLQYKLDKQVEYRRRLDEATAVVQQKRTRHGST